MVPDAFEIETQPAGEDLTLVELRGILGARHAGELRRALGEAMRGSQRVRIDLQGIDFLDGGSAAVLADTWCARREAGVKIDFVGASDAVGAVLALYTARAPRHCTTTAPRHVAIFEHVGEAALSVLQLAREGLSFIGASSRSALRALRRPRSINWDDVPSLAERMGADGLPIVLLILGLVGLTTGYQAAIQLRKFGADVFISDLVGLSIARELGPLMTAIVLAGRTGAALAAELGTMRVSEEIDALRTLNLDPYRFLVFPRVIALVVMTPLLVLLADIVGIAAGGIVAVFQLELTARGYAAGVQDAVEAWDVGGGLLKSVVFGALIALIGCERGLSARGGAAGVGRATTSAVVLILFALIAVDSIFAVLFDYLGI